MNDDPGLIQHKVSAFVQSEEFAKRLAEVCEHDPVLKRIQALYQKRIQDRLAVIKTRLWEQIRREARKRFREACRKNRAPILEERTMRFPEMQLHEKE